ncbi:MAG: hypothetical protein R3D85_08890 [Paracoccaceae bacterium]
MNEPKRYVGVDNDLNGGMTDTAKIIRDAQVFGLIPEDETCEGWLAAGIEDLWRKVNAEWEKHGFLVANLPEETRARFMAVHGAAMERARAAGWDADRDLLGDE